MKAQFLTEYTSVRILPKEDAEEIFGKLEDLESRPFPWNKAASVDGNGELEATIEVEGQATAYSDGWENSNEPEEELNLYANNSFIVVDESDQVAIFDDEAEVVFSEDDHRFENLADNWGCTYAADEEEEESIDRGRQHLSKLLKENKVIIIHM